MNLQEIPMFKEDLSLSDIEQEKVILLNLHIMFTKISGMPCQFLLEFSTMQKIVIECSMKDWIVQL